MISRGIFFYSYKFKSYLSEDLEVRFHYVMHCNNSVWSNQIKRQTGLSDWYRGESMYCLIGLTCPYVFVLMSQNWLEQWWRRSEGEGLYAAVSACPCEGANPFHGRARRPPGSKGLFPGVWLAGGCHKVGSILHEGGGHSSGKATGRKSAVGERLWDHCHPGNKLEYSLDCEPALTCCLFTE